MITELLYGVHCSALVQKWKIVSVELYDVHTGLAVVLLCHIVAIVHIGT